MDLVRLIYSSRKKDNLEVPGLLKLLDQATESNRQNKITGLLCFTDNIFLQVLEGSSSSVNQLYRKIIVDQRHTEVSLINYSFISKREFSDWAMGFVDLDAIISKKELDMSSWPNINIQTIDPVGALWLMKELSKTLHR